jgi:cephalosporin-C deacetylase
MTPQQFVSSVSRPDDFDSFWDQVLAESAALPLEAERRALPERSTPEVEVFELFFTSLGGVRIATWFTLPRHRAGPVAGLLYVPGYISDPPLSKSWSKRGYALMSVAPRGKVRSNAQYNPGYPGLLTDNLTDRNTYGYRGFFLDAVRAMDALREQPEVDPNRVGVFGSSQGGGLTIMTAALHPGVRAACAGAPYLCGFWDAIQLTSTYPYQEIRDYLRLHPERADRVRQTLAYFDGINFASRVRCPILVNIGLRDNVCPPETGFAVFAALGSAEKRLETYADCGHDAGSSRHGHDAQVREFLGRHLDVGRTGAGGSR